ILVIALLVVHRPAPWIALLGRVAHAVLPARLADRVTHLAEGLVAGLDVLKRPGRFLGVAAWSLFLWLVNAAAFAVCVRAFGLPVPPEGALVLQGVIGFGVALPSSPGFVDTVDRERTSRRRLEQDRKSTRLNSSHEWISYAVFCLKKKKMSRN